jgi:hypothetical protein
MMQSKRQADVQAFIDSLSIVERHRVCRGLNVRKNGVLVNARDSKAYNIEHLWRAHDICNSPHNRLKYPNYVSTGTAGRKDN